MTAYEDALIRRIDLRKQIDRLSPRHKQIFCGYYRHDDTLKAVAAVEGLSAARVGQIIAVGLRKIKHRLTCEPEQLQRYDLRATPPPGWRGFDKAEFLRHMALLKQARELAEQKARKRERAELDRIMSHEQAAGLFDPPRPAKVVQPRPQPPQTLWPSWPAPVVAAPPRVEPWFDRSRTPTLEDMRYLANYTLGYFVAAYRPGGPGLEHVGEQHAGIVCARDADAIAGAMKGLSDKLSRRAIHLSAKPEPVPEDMLGVTVISPYVGMRVVSVHKCQQVSIEVTWDDVQPTP